MLTMFSTQYTDILLILLTVFDTIYGHVITMLTELSTQFTDILLQC